MEIPCSSSTSQPEIPFIDPSAPLEIKQEPEFSLKITEIHTAYETEPPKDPSSDEWPEEPREIPKRKNRKKKKYIRRPKEEYEDRPKNPELEREIENLPDTETGRVNCSRCSKEVYKKYYRQHMERVHLRINRYACDCCGKKFYSRWAIEEHMNQHLNIKPLPCPFECGEFFASTTAKKKHAKKHLETEKPEYICELCGQKYKEKSRLQVSLF